MHHPITRNQVKDWFQNEVTRAYFAGIEDKIKLLERIVTEGVGSTIDEQVLEYNKLVGRILGLRDAIDVDLETVIEDN